MGNKDVIKAVFVGESKAFKKFQLVTGKCVGTVYTPKDEEPPLSMHIELHQKGMQEFDALTKQLEEKSHK